MLRPVRGGPARLRGGGSMPLSSVLDFVTEQAPVLAELSDRIWETPELGLHETKSSATLAGALEAAGFAVERGVAGMPTAFIATYGEGSPVIALLGEFDALPGLSQQRGVAEHRPIVLNGPGHGCGQLARNRRGRRRDGG